MSLDASSLLRSLDEAYRSLDAAREQLARAMETGHQMQKGGFRRTIELLERVQNLEKDVQNVTLAERRRSEKMIVLERVLLGNREMMKSFIQ